MAEAKTKDVKPNVSVCILTKNDENTIQECLESVKDFAKEIIVLDIGSTDNTVNIVRTYTNRIWGIKWNLDYSEVCNGFFKYATGEWILFLYGYEKVSIDTRHLLNNKLLDKKNIAYLFKIIQIYHEKEYATYDIKLFRRMTEIRFKHVINPTVNDDVQKNAKRKGLFIMPSDISIEKLYYRKYNDDSAYHSEVINLTSNALSSMDKRPEYYVELLYKLLKGLSLAALGEEDLAEEMVTSILEEVKHMDRKAVYNAPIFIQAYLFFCFNYSKNKDYENAFKIIAEALDIYHNSLTVLVRYAEQQYMLQDYKGCYNSIMLLKRLLDDDDFYYLESIDFDLIERLSLKLFHLSKNKLGMD